MKCKEKVRTSRQRHMLSMSTVGTPKHRTLQTGCLLQCVCINSNILCVNPSLPTEFSISIKTNRLYNLKEMKPISRNELIHLIKLKLWYQHKIQTRGHNPTYIIKKWNSKETEDYNYNAIETFFKHHHRLIHVS